MTQKKGFTLIELLIVLALIAILASILIVIIKPGEIFRRGRDTQRISDLRNLSAAVDTYISELAVNSSLLWPKWGNCSSNIFFSTTTTAAPTGWPTLPSGYSATGTASTTINGNGWVPLEFSKVSVLNLYLLPVDPQNGQTVGGVTRVYSFACDNSFGYEFSAYPENTTTAGTANDGGNQANLLEVGSKKDIY